MGEGRGVYGALVGKLEGKRSLRNPDADGRIIIRWIFRKWDVWVWIESSCLRIGDKWRALVNSVMNLRVP